MTIVFYVSGHGLGHASRSATLVAELIGRRRDVRVIVRTNAQALPFERLGGDRFLLEPCDSDSGMAQIDSLHADVPETARRAVRFYGAFDARVRDEARYLRERQARLVVADVSPLGPAAARRAGVPAILVANFTWDWIYAFHPEFEALAPGVIPTIENAYAQTTVALRLPLAGGFASIATVRDIPFIARRSLRDRDETRHALGIADRSPVVLCSFGGYGMPLPYERVARSGVTALAPTRPPPGLLYEDLVAAVDAVVSKPGYGIVSECVANTTPFLYTSRGPFAEYDVMVAEMPAMLRCRHISHDVLLSGDWKAELDGLLAQEHPAHRPRVDGAAVAASIILETA